MNQEEYEWIFSLMNCQKEMLIGKDEALSHLFNSCSSEGQQSLLHDLLYRFNFFNDDNYNDGLIGMSKFICSLPYPKDKTAILAMCHDSEADSSQAILNHIKVHLKTASGIRFKTYNRFDKIIRACNDGYNHLVVVDEFMGSGQTLMNHFKKFESHRELKDCTINFCFLAGMQQAYDKARERGINIYVYHPMQRGISDFYKGDVLDANLNYMLEIESNLAPQVDDKNLQVHSFGYGRAESIYKIKDWNIPNNVFPVFWWEKDVNGNDRKYLFVRV